MMVCALPAFGFGGGVRGQGDARWQPHDVLRLRDLPVHDGEPAWVREAFLRVPFAVVRRALSSPGIVPVGLRGANRAQRYGTWVEDADVEVAVPPEALAAREPASGRERLPAFSVLAELRRAPCSLGHYVWGPAGSVGFELATGMPTATGSSDLDLLIRAPERLDRAAAGRLLAELLAIAQRADVRVDAQLETPTGGVALAELARGKSHVMVRANTGASLVADPWAVAVGMDVDVDVASASARENAPCTRSSPQSARTSDAASLPTGGASASATPKSTFPTDVQ